MDQKNQTSEAVFQTEHSDSKQDSISPGEIIIGTFYGVNESGQALVNFSGNLTQEPVPAISTIPVTHQLCGRQVALLFAEGNINSPVIMGIIHNPLNEMLENFELSPDNQTHSQDQAATGSVKDDQALSNDDLTIDGKRIILEGKEEIVLKCGESSITLTRSGKILIRGKYLLNRSSGVNRIMGGSVQVN